MGILEDFEYNPETKELSFKTLVTEGSDGFGKFSCDHLNFRVHMDEKHPYGLIEWISDGVKLPSESIDLPLDSSHSDRISNFKNADEWEKSLDQVLKHRGPNSRCK